LDTCRLDDDFIYVSAEIALESDRRDRFEAAKQAEKLGFKPSFCDTIESMWGQGFGPAAGLLPGVPG